VNFHHVLFRLLFVPAKDSHKDVGDINHQIHRVIPTDDVKGRCQIIVELGLLFDDWLRDWF
jgi:hypothetical protein